MDKLNIGQNTNLEKKISSDSKIVDFGPSISSEGESGLFPAESLMVPLLSARADVEV